MVEEVVLAVCTACSAPVGASAAEFGGEPLCDGCAEDIHLAAAPDVRIAA